LQEEIEDEYGIQKASQLFEFLSSVHYYKYLKEHEFTVKMS